MVCLSPKTKAFDLVHEQTGFLGDLFVDAADDTGNQLLNSFGFDWCGPTFTSAAAQAGCDSDDERAQDSPCWRNEGPGYGEAVSPVDLRHWDAAPAGPYGYQEPLAYGPGGYFRVWRWEKVAGAGTVKGVISAPPATATNTLVAIEGLAAVDFADLSGAYEIEAAPEVGNYSFDETHPLEPSTADKPDAAKVSFNWQRCTGQEVLAKLKFELRLDQHDRSIHVDATTKMFEGESCNNDDLNDTVNKSLVVPEGGSVPLTMNLLNEETGGEDTIKVSLTIENLVGP